MKKYIHIKKEDREFIARAFGVSERSVFNALAWDDRRGRSGLAERVRRLAMQRGGVVMVELPEVETLHDADGYMRQYLPNGAMLEFSKEDGGCTVWHRGANVRTLTDVQVRQIPELQQWAAALR